jgi:hypothetical protein
VNEMMGKGRRERQAVRVKYVLTARRGTREANASNAVRVVAFTSGNPLLRGPWRTRQSEMNGEKDKSLMEADPEAFIKEHNRK